MEIMTVYMFCSVANFDCATITAIHREKMTHGKAALEVCLCCWGRIFALCGNTAPDGFYGRFAERSGWRKRQQRKDRPTISGNSSIELSTIRQQPGRSFGLNWKTSSLVSTFLLTADIIWDRNSHLPN